MTHENDHNLRVGSAGRQVYSPAVGDYVSLAETGQFAELDARGKVRQEQCLQPQTPTERVVFALVDAVAGAGTKLRRTARRIFSASRGTAANRRG